MSKHNLSKSGIGLAFVFLSLVGCDSNVTTGSRDTDFTGGPNQLPLVTCTDTGPAPGGNNPILFVTQMPIIADFGHLPSTFGTHRPHPSSAGRGGDLYIFYRDGLANPLRNLTREVGFGDAANQQTTNSISVRDPSVHWCGKKALFSMVRDSTNNGRWQIYEVTGLERGATATITRVANQPNYNNIYPIYDSYGRIVFASDRPFRGDNYNHLYPQLDEYEMIATNTGLWNLDPATGKSFLMDHSPSGNFRPIIDSFGRLVFTRWDHAIRDDLALNDNIAIHQNQSPPYQTFNYDGEHVGSGPIVLTNGKTTNEEFYPEPNSGWLFYVNNNGGSNFSGNKHGWEANLQGVSTELNNFLPWMMRQDGRQLETLNHVGRHELFSTTSRAFSDDNDLITRFSLAPGIANGSPIGAMHMIKENPLVPGSYYAINAPEFRGHASGQIFALTGAPNLNGDEMVVSPKTHPSTQNYCEPAASCPNTVGLFRNPLPLTNGQLLAGFTSNTLREFDSQLGDQGTPATRFHFRINKLKLNVAGTYYIPDVPLLPAPINRTLSGQVTYSGEMWEFDPVEVVSRPVPAEPPIVYEEPEMHAARLAGVTGSEVVKFLKDNNLALVISRNITVRDKNDRQQPYNLQVEDSLVKTVDPGSNRANNPYIVEYLQFVEGRLIRGTGGTQACIDNPATMCGPGRRVNGQPMSSTDDFNPPTTGLQGTVVIDIEDGSMAAIVPARRAMSWFLTDPNDKGVVRERFWVTFQPGEVRVCANCHGLNHKDQSGHLGAPENSPKAAIKLFQHLKNNLRVIN